MNAIYLETGKKKVLAVAVNWPGWCRGGEDENSAVRTLLDYGPRYARIPQAAGIEFELPAGPQAFTISDRLQGNASTDYGVPDKLLPNDWDAVEEEELQRLKQLVSACWLIFDQAVEGAQGKELRKGPRGGGRELDQILDHVLGAEGHYLEQMGLKPEGVNEGTVDQRLAQMRAEVLRGLETAAPGHLPRFGPRGGKRWPPRYFVRRLAWHVLDHTWEIEDRTMD